MGIRVHKAIGYGLTDVKYRDLKCIDPRFDPEGWMMNRDSHEDGTFTVKGYLKYCDAIIKDLKDRDVKNDPMWMLSTHWMKESIAKSKWELWNSIEWDAEFGLGRVLHFVVPGCPHHKRYDDIIDYYEEQGKGGNCMRATLLGRALYPWEGYIDSRTGKRLNSIVGLMLNDFKVLKRMKHKLSPNFHRDRIRNAAKDDTILPEHCVPDIPPELVALCKYVKMFKDPLTIYQLRPMVYVYWG